MCDKEKTPNKERQNDSSMKVNTLNRCAYQDAAVQSQYLQTEAVSRRLDVFF